MMNKKLLEFFGSIEGVLIIKGEKSWVNCLKKCGFSFNKENLGAGLAGGYKIGGLEIIFSKNPHYIKDVIGLD